MKVYISADIEGVTGVVTWGQCGGPRPGHFDWAFARRMMTHDVNAAIRGARAAGAKEIVVKDSHNTSKNLLIDELEEGVELISGTGSGRDGMMEGIDDTFDASFLVGYHGMAGTMHGIMEHTINGQTHQLLINGQPAGEILMSALTAGQYGVPLVFVSSDRAGCSESRQVVPGIGTAETKVGLGRYMGRVYHPSVTGPRIEAAAKSALESRDKIEPAIYSAPLIIQLTQNRSEEADAVATMPNWKRIDAFTLELEAPNWPEAHAWTRRAMQVAGGAAGNND